MRINANAYGSRYEIVKTLLQHYKTLSIFGVRFTWLGIHKLYRVMLVACTTYISDPLTRICSMMIGLLTIALLNNIIKPYRGSRANATAAVSYTANVCVAVINLVRALMMGYVCQYNCSEQRTYFQYMDQAEKALLVYLPALFIFLWLISLGVNKCRAKPKEGEE